MKLLDCYNFASQTILAHPKTQPQEIMWKKLIKMRKPS